MSTDSLGRTKDISVLQLITRLVVETEKLIKLADDINQYATTPQAKSAMNLIGREVNSILAEMKSTIGPLYNLYEVDPGLRAARPHARAEHSAAEEADEYDESALWTDVKKQTP